MEIVRLTSGLISQRLSKQEQDILWQELSQDVSVIGKDIALFTPRDNLAFYIISETEIKYDSYKAVIRANGKIITIKYNICNQQDKTNKAVRKAYNQ